MSLSYSNINPVQVLDPRVILKNERYYAVLQGGKMVTPQTFVSTSVSQNSITFVTPPPAGGFIVDRKVMLTCSMRLTITATVAPGQQVLNVNRDAPRQFPLSSGMDNIKANINNQTVNVDMADIIHPLMHFNVDQKLKNLDYSMSASCPDQSQYYSDMNDTIRNPLGVYGDSLDETTNGRGASSFFVVSNPTNTTGFPSTLGAIVDCQFTEPIFLLTPFYWGKGNGSGLYNVTAMQWTFNFLTQAGNRFWSHDENASGSVVTNVSYIFGGNVGGPTTSGYTAQPTLLFNFITPLDTALLGPSTSISYPYFSLDKLLTPGTSFAPGVIGPITSNNFQLTSIPRRCYIWVRRQNNFLYTNPKYTDSFFSIEGLNLTFANRTGIFASATKEQLYAICVKNHCQMSWEQWSGNPVYTGRDNFVTKYNTIGSVFCFDWTDVGLDDNYAPGSTGQFSLQFTVNCKNTTNETITPMCYFLPVYEGIFTIPKLGAATIEQGVLTQQNVLNSAKNGSVSYKEVENVNGGDVFSGIREFFSEKILPLIKESKIASTLASFLPVVGTPLSKTISNLGYGNGVMAAGGAPMSRSDLRSRLMR
jgi:hypothetical protein